MLAAVFNHRISGIYIFTALAAMVAVPCTTCGQECGEPVDFGFEVHEWTETGGVDCAVAVGPVGILAITNDGLWLFDRDGTEIDDHVSLDGFFGSGKDTVCAYDREASRFFALTLYSSGLRLAVSQSSTPDLDPANWYFFTLTGLPGIVDYPSMSLGEEYVYISWARLGGGPAGRAVIASVTKDDLIAGQTPTVI